MRRFLSLTLPSSGQTVFLDKEVSHHLLRVVGIAPLEKVELFNGRGLGCVAYLQSVQNGLAEMAWVSSLILQQKDHSLTLVLALTKGDAFGTALRMCTELGVDTFVPLQAQRSIPKGDKQYRWSKIVNGAAAQSKRLTTPRVLPLQTWRSLWEVLDQAGSSDRWVLQPTAATVLPVSPMTTNTTMFIGPEGGFTTQELEDMKDKHCQTRSLGSLVLKADTAAIVSCSRALS